MAPQLMLLKSFLHETVSCLATFIRNQVMIPEMIRTYDISSVKRVKGKIYFVVVQQQRQTQRNIQKSVPTRAKL